MFTCEKCSAVFKSKLDFDIHKAIKHTVYSEYLCLKCDKSFTNKYNLTRHETLCGDDYQCKKCHHKFSNTYNGKRHEEVCGEGVGAKKRKLEPTKKELIGTTPDANGISEYETAFENRLKSYFIRLDKCHDLECYLENSKDVLAATISEQLKVYKALKVNLVVECNFSHLNEELSNRAFKTVNKSVLVDTDINEFLTSAFQKLKSEMEESQLKKSGWALLAVDGLRLRINKYNPLRGSTYIPLPQEIAKKKACINVKNNDEKCFMYSILAKHINKNTQRVKKYKNLDHKYNFECISFPTTFEDIYTFEKKNNISVNVYGIDKLQIYPLRIAIEEKEDHRDLLLLHDKNETKHYVYIKSFSRLVQSQFSKREHSLAICKRCLTHFDDQNGKTKEQKLGEHTYWCKQNNPVRVEMPHKKPYIEFENVGKVMRVPYVIYCDFESLLKPVDGCKPNYEESYTISHQQHESMSFCAYLKQSDDVMGYNSTLPTEPFTYRGPDASKHLVKYLSSIANQVSEIYTLNAPMIPLTVEQENAYKICDACYMCNKIIHSNDVKVRDHCHITGKYRGAAHSICNLNYKAPTFLPVLFHNLSGYDSHYIVKELGYDSKQIEVIPNTEEKYISFSKTINKHIKLRFLDTFRFMSSGLDELANNISNLKEIPKFFDEDKIPLLTRKGIFPYDYVTSWDKLNDKRIPKQEEFYNSLNLCHISDEDYQHACNVWKTFENKNLGEYSDLYLKTDVLLLAEIFESFRDITIKTHKLDPCHYYTLPGLSWDAMLRFTQIKLELIQDYDMILMIEQGIRGGICQASHRYIKANNKHMDNYNPEEDSVYISYQDCTNLYGYAMSQSLPIDSFEWIDPNCFNIEDHAADDKYGYILDVDIDYPSHLHNLHDSLPFLPEVITINKQKKLVPHLNRRRNYVLHYVALKQALKRGLILVKINRIIKFRQAEWLKPYIDYNTDLRKNAKNTFEKDTYKLYNNSVYGKTMENIRNRLNIKLVSGAKRLEKLFAKPEFIDRTIYSENLAAVHLAKKSIIFDKPIYLGMSILDISKCVMYHYHYDVMLEKYGTDRLKLAYMDTDSFVYRIRTDDIFNDMTDLLGFMDTSDYPQDHHCYSTINKKVPGKFKDEVNGAIILKFVALRAKMYSIQLKGKVIKKAKGVQTAVVKKCIDFDDYEDCLFSGTTLRMPMNQIRSQQHNLSTIETNKLALSPHDDKRIILKDGIETKAIGHYGYEFNKSLSYE